MLLAFYESKLNNIIHYIGKANLMHTNSPIWYSQYALGILRRWFYIVGIFMGCVLKFYAIQWCFIVKMALDTKAYPNSQLYSYLINEVSASYIWSFSKFFPYKYAGRPWISCMINFTIFIGRARVNLGKRFSDSSFDKVIRRKLFFFWNH